MAVKVFICHSSIDTWVAHQIAAKIEALGATVFLDDDNIVVGDNFVERIQTAVPDCTELLVLLTPWAITRPWVLVEIACFMLGQKRIVGVIHGLTPDEAMKDPYIGILLDNRVLLDINRLDSYFRELAGRIKTDAEGGSDA